MPEINEVFNEMRKAHVVFTEKVDKELNEVRKNGEVSAETKEQVEKVETAITELRAKYEEVLKSSKRPNATGQTTEQTKEEETRKSAFIKFLRTGIGEQSFGSMNEDERRALSSSSDADGGFLVPTTFESEIITNAYEEAELRPLMNVAPTGRDAVHLPVLSKPVVAWGVKNLVIPEQQLTAGTERIEIFDLRALTLIANNTLDDSASDVASELIDLFGMAIAEAEDDAFAVGPADKTPGGVLTDARVLLNEVKTGVAAALSDATNNGVDHLITMLQSLKKTYRRNSTWAMNSTTEGDVRKLKDDQGQYLWQPPVQPGNPALLLGRPIVNPEAYPDVVANSNSITLGDFRKGYKVRDRSGMSVQRLTERYADFDQTGFIIKKRLGGQVTLAEAFVVSKTAV